jgi:transposase
MQPELTFQHYTGIDWATEAHRICLLDHEGRLVAKTTIAHSGDGLAQLLAWVHQHGAVPARTAVAIEVPRGAVVETLTERGFSVFHLNPKQLDRFRDRYSTAGAKDDDRDAFVLASALRTDLALFHPVPVEPESLIQLRELFRAADELRGEMQRHSSRLREQLNRYYPQMLVLCPAAQQPFLWDLLEAAPLPASAAALEPERVQGLLKARQIRRLTAAQILATLGRPALPLAPGAALAASQHALVLVAQLRIVRQQRDLTLKRLREVLRHLRAQRNDGARPSDVEIIESLPGAGELTTAALLTESAQALAERDPEALRAYSGIAPVTRQSGKRRSVSMRYACNQRLRNALYFQALCSLRGDPVSRRHYDALRQAGHSHARALRGVSDRLLTVLIAMLRQGTLYDPRLRKAWRAGDEFVSAEAGDE